MSLWTRLRAPAWASALSLVSATAHAQPRPTAPPAETSTATEDDAPDSSEPGSLIIATDPPEPDKEIARPPTPKPPPKPPPKRPSFAPQQPPVEHAEWLGAMSVAPIGVIAHGADVGDYQSTFVGISLVSTVGHITYLPEDSGLLADFRWQFGLMEIPLSLYRSTLDAMVGYRLDLGRRHALYAKGGANGSGGGALKWWRAALHLPNAGVGYVWQARDNLFQLGPEAALAMVGAFRLGKAANLTLDENNRKDYHGVSYSFRPHAAARADLQISPVALSASYGRTFLAGGEDGERLDDATVTLCAALPEQEDFPFGGCVFTNILWGDMRRQQPNRLELTSGAGWYAGASIVLARVGAM